MSNLPKIVKRSSKRLGRGYGSGKGGHTSSRGQKGQKARGSVGILFEGLKVKKSLLRRLPFLRGKSKFAAKPAPLAVNVDVLNSFSNDEVVDVATLISKKIIGKTDAKYGVKLIMGRKGLDKKLNVKLKVSKGARDEILKNGGLVA